MMVCAAVSVPDPEFDIPNASNQYHSRKNVPNITPSLRQYDKWW